ncbi:MAG: FAD-dependent oxidoreductase [Candidatus Methanomethylophilaceae archaeon]|jgi:thioredoxin reductase (NADPH)|nr:FAD-dependent oxidoreductase [Candidatus Methanomethylophilaceae archaeon]NCA74098.1 thioredoxin reductase [Gammaproteobacteria bacterium]MDD2936368.1 FAD-dependent oxidoreductase [Candidatus Methanomethylophilaceae archaeon]MDD3351233.1 FAD-dependent oxidoreductase [Candidatus Methanomethylophilaceae archaeon]MDD3986779.1 FAD-dependent oxidoreductase [Candidatus Methanomethylophilaceae archaeon]
METDIVVIGAGPSGIQAAIYAARRKVSTVIVGKPSNSAAADAHIENYFGVVGPVKGIDLLGNGIKQATAFGAEFVEENVISAERDGKLFIVKTETGKEYTAKSVIVATGISRVKLGIPGEKEFIGKGVSYCSVCDCNFYKGKTVAVIGDETEAAMSADLMTKYATQVYWMTKDPKAAKALVDRALLAGVVMRDSPPKEIKGDGKVGALVLEDGSEIAVDGIFIELGAKSAADLVMDMDLMPEMDDTIKVDAKYATKVPGLFACGDVVGKPWQVARAVGQGCMAGLSAADYVKGAK